jgi:hypothetical protein
MAVEAKRGCGYRKVGGMYLVSGKLNAGCNWLPYELSVCPCCGEGIKQARGWTWISPKKLFANKSCALPTCGFCPVSNPPERGGLIWVGGKFYPEPEDFMAEARSMGVSRRINTVPHDFVVGETQVYFAHPKGIKKLVEMTPDEQAAYMLTPTLEEMLAGRKMKEESFPAIICSFVPTAIEILVTESQSLDADFMAGLAKRKLTPVIVPDDDPDHQGSVHDKAPKDDQGNLVHDLGL